MIGQIRSKTLPRLGPILPAAAAEAGTVAAFDEPTNLPLGPAHPADVAQVRSQFRIVGDGFVDYLFCQHVHLAGCPGARASARPVASLKNLLSSTSRIFIRVAVGGTPVSYSLACTPKRYSPIRAVLVGCSQTIAAFARSRVRT